MHKSVHEASSTSIKLGRGGNERTSYKVKKYSNNGTYPKSREANLSGLLLQIGNNFEHKNKIESLEFMQVKITN